MRPEYGASNASLKVTSRLARDELLDGLGAQRLPLDRPGAARAYADDDGRPSRSPGAAGDVEEEVAAAAVDQLLARPGSACGPAPVM